MNIDLMMAGHMQPCMQPCMQLKLYDAHTDLYTMGRVPRHAHSHAHATRALAYPGVDMK